MIIVNVGWTLRAKPQVDLGHDCRVREERSTKRKGAKPWRALSMSRLNKPHSTAESPDHFGSMLCEICGNHLPSGIMPGRCLACKDIESLCIRGIPGPCVNNKSLAFTMTSRTQAPYSLQAPRGRRPTMTEATLGIHVRSLLTLPSRPSTTNERSHSRFPNPCGTQRTSGVAATPHHAPHSTPRVVLPLESPVRPRDYP